MPEVVSWPSAEPREVIARAVDLLAQGQLVVFPTVSGYMIAACAMQPAAVARLHQITGHTPTIALNQPAQALDWAPALSPLGQRLTRKGWPGPWTLLTTEGIDHGGVQ